MVTIIKGDLQMNELFIGVLIFNIALIVLYYYIYYKDKKIRENIYSNKFISYSDFEKDWISIKYGNKGIAGYKYNDRPGCYVILIFDSPVVDENFTGYINIYIGQSVNVCKRIHSHFNGKGNGDVYADIKYGKSVYVQIVPCDKTQLNRVEKELIQAFNATKSYNKTRGGAKRL